MGTDTAMKEAGSRPWGLNQRSSVCPEGTGRSREPLESRVGMTEWMWGTRECENSEVTRSFLAWVTGWVTMPKTELGKRGGDG